MFHVLSKMHLQGTWCFGGLYGSLICDQMLRSLRSQMGSWKMCKWKPRSTFSVSNSGSCNKGLRILNIQKEWWQHDWCLWALVLRVHPMDREKNKYVGSGQSWREEDPTSQYSIRETKLLWPHHQTSMPWKVNYAGNGRRQAKERQTNS